MATTLSRTKIVLYDKGIKQTIEEVMFRLSKMSDYAIVIMRYLGQCVSTTQNANQIAVHTHLAVPTVSKLLKRLAKAGLLQSQRGVTGGYSLARRPDEINLAHILQAMGEYHGLTECSDDSHHCSFAPVCEMQGHWRVINAAIDQALRQVTLFDLRQPANEYHLKFSQLG